MKVTTNINQSNFVPFNVIISIESLDDALTLLAMFNLSKSEREKLVKSQQLKQPKIIANTETIFYAISNELKQQHIDYH